jgi:hypothetical protein
MYFYGGALIMKMKITVEIQNNSGDNTVNPITIDANIPEFEEFKDSSNFREVFHKYEQSVLKARNAAAELATEGYLTELSKKKSIKRPKSEKE